MSPVLHSAGAGATDRTPIQKIRLRQVSACRLARSEGNNCRSIAFSALDDVLPAFSLIVNTVPALILDRERLKKLREQVLVLDLASKPGGDDAGERKVRAV